jgi:hypothetical protein
MIQRFLERLQLWWEAREQERRGSNPLTWLAIIAVLLLGLDIYRAVAAHRVAWSAILNDVLLIVFLVLYVRDSPFAWFVVPTFGAMTLVQSPFIFFSSSAHYPPRARFFTFVFMAALGLVVIAYGFLVRRRYEIYLRDRREATPII